MDVSVVGERVVEHHAEHVEHGLGERLDERVLGAEVVEDGRPGDLGRCAMSAIVTSSKPRSAKRSPATSRTRCRWSSRQGAPLDSSLSELGLGSRDPRTPAPRVPTGSVDAMPGAP